MKNVMSAILLAIAAVTATVAVSTVVTYVITALAKQLGAEPDIVQIATLVTCLLTFAGASSLSLSRRARSSGNTDDPAAPSRADRHRWDQFLFFAAGIVAVLASLLVASWLGGGPLYGF